MAKTVADIMVPLSEYAVVDEHATILEALQALQEAQAIGGVVQRSELVLPSKALHLYGISVI